MAIAKTLCVFNDLGRLVTPIFLLMGRFSNDFLYYAKKMKKIYWVKVWIFCKMLYQIPFFWPLHLALRQFEIPLWGLRMMAMFETMRPRFNYSLAPCVVWVLIYIYYFGKISKTSDQLDQDRGPTWKPATADGASILNKAIFGSYITYCSDVVLRIWFI